jgi:hypothetical protein
MKSLIALIALLGLAQDAKKRDLKDRVEISGTIVCVGCTLEKEAGAEAQCTLHARHAQGLKAADGTLYTFVDNAKGHIVMTNDKLRGKEVKVLGWKYPKSNYIEVSKYQVKDGDKWVAYDYCKTCGFEKGDNKDSDLCEDCKK